MCELMKKIQLVFPVSMLSLHIYNKSIYLSRSGRPKPAVKLCFVVRCLTACCPLIHLSIITSESHFDCLFQGKHPLFAFVKALRCCKCRQSQRNHSWCFRPAPKTDGPYIKCMRVGLPHLFNFLTIRQRNCLVLMCCGLKLHSKWGGKNVHSG